MVIRVQVEKYGQIDVKQLYSEQTMTGVFLTVMVLLSQHFMEILLLFPVKTLLS